VFARVYTHLLLRDTLKQIEERNAALDEKTRMLASLSVKLSKYLSPQVYASIFAGSRDVELATERKRLTVFFSDIKDFVSTTADMQPEDLTAMSGIDADPHLDPSGRRPGRHLDLLSDLGAGARHRGRRGTRQHRRQEHPARGPRFRSRRHSRRRSRALHPRVTGELFRV
jgi:hypothetical protein